MVHAPAVGAVETNTVARPPRATNPITPTLKSPANPHCRFTPSDMMAEINPMFSMSNAVFQLCVKPVIRIIAPTMAKSRVFFTAGFIPLSP